MKSEGSIKTYLALFLFLSSFFMQAAPSLIDKEITSSVTIYSDSSKKSPFLKNIYTTGEFFLLHTTHYDLFFGGSITASTFLTNRLLIGLGVEYSHAPYHYEYGFKLSQVTFIPVYADIKLFLTSPQKMFSPFIQLDPGISFASYIKHDIITQLTYPVAEPGLYLYGGIGCLFKLNNRISFPFSIGFKGFHMSSNDNVVNPHGVVYRLVGITIKF